MGGQSSALTGQTGTGTDAGRWWELVEILFSSLPLARGNRISQGNRIPKSCTLSTTFYTRKAAPTRNSQFCPLYILLKNILILKIEIGNSWHCRFFTIYQVHSAHITSLDPGKSLKIQWQVMRWNSNPSFPLPSLGLSCLPVTESSLVSVTAYWP